jgi:channel protein (hemolysin III family)
MSWLLALAIARVKIEKIIWLLIGGILYTCGSFVNMSGYTLSHEVFHIFVIAGAACHIKFFSQFD